VSRRQAHRTPPGALRAAEADEVGLDIFDIRADLVRQLENEAVLPGCTPFSERRDDRNGAASRAGIYLLRHARRRAVCSKRIIGCVDVRRRERGSWDRSCDVVAMGLDRGGLSVLRCIGQATTLRHLDLQELTVESSDIVIGTITARGRTGTIADQDPHRRRGDVSRSLKGAPGGHLTLTELGEKSMAPASRCRAARRSAPAGGGAVRVARCARTCAGQRASRRASSTSAAIR
jgi:hypothetical protein